MEGKASKFKPAIDFFRPKKKKTETPWIYFDRGIKASNTSPSSASLADARPDQEQIRLGPMLDEGLVRVFAVVGRACTGRIGKALESQITATLVGKHKCSDLPAKSLYCRFYGPGAEFSV